MSIRTVIGRCVMPRDIFHAAMWKKDTEFLDDEQYEVCISPFVRKANALQIHLAALCDGQVLRFSGLNETMKQDRIRIYLDELQKRLSNIVEKLFMWPDDGEHELVISYGYADAKKRENICATNMRIVLMLKDSLPMQREEELLVRKRLKGELLNWMEEVRHDVQVDQRAAYEKDYRAILAADLLPHEKENTDILNTMTIISVAILFVSFFIIDYFFCQVVALVVAGYTAYRSFQKQKYVSMGICIAVAVVAMLLCFIAYKELSSSMQGVDLGLSTPKK